MVKTKVDDILMIQVLNLIKKEKMVGIFVDADYIHDNPTKEFVELLLKVQSEMYNEPFQSASFEGMYHKIKYNKYLYFDTINSLSDNRSLNKKRKDFKMSRTIFV